MGRRTWIKIFADNWLTGTLREETSSIRGTWIDVLALAGDSTYGDEGLIQVADGVGLTDEQIAAILCIPVKQWLEGKQRLIDTERIQVSKHNVIRILKWKRYQSEYERTKEAQKRYRERKSIPQNYHPKLSPEPIKEKREERREKRDIKKERDKERNKHSLSKREKDFLKELHAYPQFSSIIKEFFDYWTEPNKSKTKMRFEQQKTWDTKRRLRRWAGNDFGKKGKIPDRTAQIEKERQVLEKKQKKWEKEQAPPPKSTSLKGLINTAKNIGQKGGKG